MWMNVCAAEMLPASFVTGRHRSRASQNTCRNTHVTQRVTATRRAPSCSISQKTRAPGRRVRMTTAKPI